VYVYVSTMILMISVIRKWNRPRSQPTEQLESLRMGCRTCSFLDHDHVQRYDGMERKNKE
jgi:hypothetical protein